MKHLIVLVLLAIVFCSAKCSEEQVLEKDTSFSSNEYLVESIKSVWRSLSFISDLKRKLQEVSEDPKCTILCENGNAVIKNCKYTTLNDDEEPCKVTCDGNMFSMTNCEVDKDATVYMEGRLKIIQDNIIDPGVVAVKSAVEKARGGLDYYVEELRKLKTRALESNK